MTQQNRMKTGRCLGRPVGLVIFLFLVLPALAEEKPVSMGCTMSQLRSPQGSICIDKADKDLINKAPKSHILMCKGASMVCCLQDGHGAYGNCEVMGETAPPAEVACSTLKSAKGVWQPDPKTIKMGSNKFSCTMVYSCVPPLPKELTESQNKCTAFVSVSNKQVTMNGTCEPGNGACTTCRTNPPNDPCSVSFRK